MDACTHSNQGVGPEIGLLEYSHCATQEHPCAMACFRLLRDGYDTEVIFVYGTEPVLLYFFFYCLLLIIVVCDLYFDSYILVVIIIYLLY